MLTVALVVSVVSIMASVSSVCAWRVHDSAGTNMHFYDRDKLHQQNKRFDMTADYFDPNAQQWGQYGGPGGGGGPFGGQNGGGGPFGGQNGGGGPFGGQSGSGGPFGGQSGSGGPFGGQSGGGGPFGAPGGGGGQFEAQGGGGANGGSAVTGGNGGNGGSGGTGEGNHYFGDNFVFGHYDNSVKPLTKQRPLSDGTLDSMQYCKCISGPECEPTAKQPAKSHYACGAGQILCCYDGHPRYQQQRNSDRYQNDGPYISLQNTGTISDKKWNPVNDPQQQGKDPQDPGYYAPNSISRLPNYQGQSIAGIGEPANFANLPPGGKFLNERPGPASASANYKPKKFLNNRPVLVRPGGVAGMTGPNTHNDILNGPNNIPDDNNDRRNSPPRIIGPGLPQENLRKPVLTGPAGSRGIVGPPIKNYHLTSVSLDEAASHALNHDMLLGADGIMHLVDRAAYTDEERNTAASAQRGVLVGPGGATGIVGPDGREDLSKGRKGLLVGPGGPWGAIGPVDYEDTSASAQRGVLVGPGGPTGIIGPAGFSNRPRVLVGPGGPTGIIGPGRRPFNNRQSFPSGFGPYGYRAQKTVLGPNWLSETSQRGVLVGPGGPTGQIGPPPRI